MAIGAGMIRDLLENGVHFGHQTNKWNPKMAKYIFGEKCGIYIIDLKKTEEALQTARDFVYELASQGKRILFAGTKKQAKKIIREEAQKCDMFFVDERWLGGCLTNFATIKKSVEKLDHLQEMKESEVYSTLAKKEKARMDREESKLLKNLEGIRKMEKLPDCLVVVDAEAEDIAVKEARKIGIPVVALIDTNCNPEGIDFPIPGNDDAIRSIRYIISTLADAAEKGRGELMGTQAVESKPKEFISSKKEEAKPAEQPAAVEEQEPAVAEEIEESEVEESPEEIEEEEIEAADGDIKLDK